MKKIRVSAPGKIILLGEHAVVYGNPAIIGAVAQRCSITITPINYSGIEIISENLSTSLRLTEKEIIKKTEQATKKWNEYIDTNNIPLLKSITAKPLDYATIIIGEALRYLKKKSPQGFSLSINSEIPIGSGMGSSAALAVSIAGAMLLAMGEKLDKEKINEIAFLAEQKRHGTPSGGDNSTSCYGGLIWYRKETVELKIIQPIPFQIDPKLQKNFYTIFTGTPKESTGEMVSIVRDIFQKHKRFTKNIFYNHEQITRELLSALKKGDEEVVRNTILQCEKNLERLGIVSPIVKSLIRKIEKMGGVAKICGSGDKSQATGVLLIFHNKPRELQELVKSYNFYFSPVKLGAEGVRQDRLE